MSNILRSKKMLVAYIHGEVPQSERKQVMNRFRDGKLQVLVATDVAARGLDVENVDLVINFTVAHSGDDHVHRVGRTGRSDQKGKAVTLVNTLDYNLMSSIERYLKVRFEVRKIEGLVAKYSGPKKVKKSGKPVGKKNKSKKLKAKSTVKSRVAKSKSILSNNVTGEKKENRTCKTLKKTSVKKVLNDGFEVFSPKNKK